MVRKDSWAQDSPQMQLALLLQAVQGDLLNIADGFPTNDPSARLERMQVWLTEALQIVRSLPNTDWCVERDQRAMKEVYSDEVQT